MKNTAAVRDTAVKAIHRELPERISYIDIEAKVEEYAHEVLKATGYGEPDEFIEQVTARLGAITLPTTNPGRK